MTHHARILLATAVLMGSLAILPSVQAGFYTEGFEDDATGGQPTSSFYTFTTTAGSSGFVSTTQANTGSKSYEQQVSTSRPLFNLGGNFCNFPQSIEVFFYYDTFSAGQSNYIGMAGSGGISGASTQGWFIGIDDAGVVDAKANAGSTNSLQFTTVLTTDTWNSVVITAPIGGETAGDATLCDGAGVASASFTLNGEETLVVPFLGADISAAIQTLTTGKSAGSLPHMFLDDISVSFTGEPGPRFCAQPNLDDLTSDADPTDEIYGYDYLEQASYDESPPGAISFSDAFILPGESGDSSYLGKGFAAGSQAFSTRARVEADFELPDNGRSLLRIAYTTGTGTLSDGASADNAGDQTLAGNGQNTGNFEDNIQAVFTEATGGTHWIIGIYYSIGGSTLSPIGATSNYGNPQNPTTFNFTVNSSGSTVNGQFGSTPAYTATITDGEGNVIVSRTIPEDFQVATWKDAWLIGKGATLDTAYTAVDDNTDTDDNSDSTCIFDLIGTSVATGSSGSTPGSQVPDTTDTTTDTSTCNSVLCTSDATVPEGFTVAAFNGFLGLLLMAAVTVGGVSAVGATGQSRGLGLIVAVFGAIGYLVALYFGLLPLWPVVVAAIIAAVVLVLRGFRGGQ